MDRLWAAVAATLMLLSMLAAFFGAWISSIAISFLGTAIVALLASDEFHIGLGPLRLLRVGRVWAVDLGSVGVYGIGWRIRFRRVEK